MSSMEIEDWFNEFGSKPRSNEYYENYNCDEAEPFQTPYHNNEDLINDSDRNLFDYFDDITVGQTNDVQSSDPLPQTEDNTEVVTFVEVECETSNVESTALESFTNLDQMVGQPSVSSPPIQPQQVDCPVVVVVVAPKRKRGRPAITDPIEKMERRKKREREAARKYRQKKKSEEAMGEAIITQLEDMIESNNLKLNKIKVEMNPLIQWATQQIQPFRAKKKTQLSKRLANISRKLDS